MLAAMISEIVEPGNYVICLGAGSITSWAYALPDEMEAIFNQSAKRARG
jgi:UDP-N-acetylmuramate--alanine ligase